MLKQKGPQLAEPEYDENFRILRAGRSFFKDLGYYRAKCEMRNAPVAVAWLDIDDFKRLNTKYLHIMVDRNVLPRFMETIESHVFSHGMAYRQSGDEYKVLLPNMSADVAQDFLDQLRIKLAGLEYRDIEERTTISIGLCEVGSDSYLTDREVDDRANKAMAFAKDAGKNRIAAYEDSVDISTVRVVRP